VTRAVFRAAAVAATLAAACGPPKWTAGMPLRPAPRAAESRPGENWPLPPEDAEQLFAKAPLRLRSLKPTAQGVAGAYKAAVQFPRGRRVAVKWKTVPAGDFDGWNNNPRKELAAYAVQRWFLDPKDYVVPTTALRCILVDAFQELVPGATPSLEGTRCVLGTMSLWLDEVEVPKRLYDPQEFASDPWYAYHFSNFNLFAYLVEHRDGRAGNILVSDDDDRRIFAVDNGISFGGLIYNFLTTNWDAIRVPALRHEAIERLRAVDRARLDALGTLVELAIDRKGLLRPVEGGAPIDPNRGVRITKDRVQMGLTRAEIDAVAARLKTLLQRVDDGTQPVF
jgi:hypothetical protein